MTLGFHGLSEFPLSTVSSAVAAASGQTAIYLASQGFTTGAADTPANTHFPGVLSKPPVIERSIVGSGFLGGRAIDSVGIIEFLNAEGTFDDAVSNFAVDGRRVLVKVAAVQRDENGVDAVPAYSLFDTYFDGSALGWKYGERSIKLELRSNDFLLQIPFQTDRYDGGGGQGGDTDLAGRPKPRCFGEVENITPVFLQSTAREGTDPDPQLPFQDVHLVYQIHDRRVQAITAVFDGGAELVKGVDYPDFESLNGASTASGTYDTCLAIGMFKLGLEPVFDVTVDALGDAEGGYVDSTASIVRRLVELAGIPKRLVNGGFFDSFEARQSAPVGIYIDEDGISFVEVINRLVGGVSGYWGFGRDGRLMIGRITDPSGKKGGDKVGTDEILSIAKLDLPYQLPHFRISVTYRRNWSPRTGNLAAAATKKQFRQDAFRIADASDTTIRSRHLLAKDSAPIEAYFVKRSDAQKEAKRLLKIYGPDRALYRIAIKARGFTKEIGQTVRIKHPRWGLSAGKPFLIVAIRVDAGRNRVDLTCFG